MEIYRAIRNTKMKHKDPLRMEKEERKVESRDKRSKGIARDIRWGNVETEYDFNCSTEVKLIKKLLKDNAMVEYQDSKTTIKVLP